MSIWVGMPISGRNNDAITVRVKYKGIEETEFSIDKLSVPWEPPFNILGANHSVEVMPSANITSISLFLQPAKLLDVEVI